MMIINGHSYRHDNIELGGKAKECVMEYNEV